MINLFFAAIIVVAYLVFAGYCLFTTYGMREDED